MKKMFLLMMGLMLAAVVAGCTSDKGEDSAKDKSPVTYVTPQSVTEKIENKETFAFILGDETCSACNQYKAEALSKMVKKDDIKLGFVELNGIEQKEEEMNSIVSLIETHLDNQFSATPTTYFIVDGVLKEVTVGAISYDELKELYTKHILSADTSKVEEKAEDKAEDNTEVKAKDEAEVKAEDKVEVKVETEEVVEESKE